MAVAVVVAFVAFRGPPATPDPLVLPRAVPSTAGGSDASGETGSTGPDGGTGDGSSADGRGSAGAYVHAAGAVARPGVYRVRAGGRVSDLLDAAGGPAADADLDQVNLAAKVADGERVYVPRRGEAPPPVAGPSGAGASGVGGASSGPVNLNTATLEQLDGLPGIGPATAQAILDYRKTRGRFRSVDELMEVRGIGEAKLAAIRSKVRV
ncbi:MAG TPA: helix-hairpin-helix domain-containing protein [Acidimicrobiales bacterium]|nr:helix-hairpin-helix domain-containing protein [Acidimicrobiales bacterium]